MNNVLDDLREYIEVSELRIIFGGATRKSQALRHASEQ